MLKCETRHLKILLKPLNPLLSLLSYLYHVPKTALISVTNNICGGEPNKYLSDIIINKWHLTQWATSSNLQHSLFVPTTYHTLWFSNKLSIGFFQSLLQANLLLPTTKCYDFSKILSCAYFFSPYSFRGNSIQPLASTTYNKLRRFKFCSAGRLLPVQPMWSACLSQVPIDSQPHPCRGAYSVSMCLSIPVSEDLYIIHLCVFSLTWHVLWVLHLLSCWLKLGQSLWAACTAASHIQGCWSLCMGMVNTWPNSWAKILIKLLLTCN